MHQRSLAFVLTLTVIVAAGLAAPDVAVGQAAAARADGAVRAEGSMPRTPWGVPDLNGTWVGSTQTPMERPERFKGREFLTEQEVAALEAEARASQFAENPVGNTPGRNTGTYNAIWTDSGTAWVPSRRSSLVIDPPDGRIPSKIPHDEGTLQEHRAYGVGPFNSYVDLDTGERCLGDGLPQIWQGYNPNHQIFQTRDYVVILHEMFRERRVIPIDNRPAADVSQWNGQSRGRWEGDTLVVESTHFPDRPGYRWASIWRAPTSTLQVVERFTRVDQHTINYRATITDPAKFRRPWTIEFPLTSNQAERGVTQGKLLEFACHEGNYAVPNVLSGERAQEKAAAAAGTARR